MAIYRTATYFVAAAIVGLTMLCAPAPARAASEGDLDAARYKYQMACGLARSWADRLKELPAEIDALDKEIAGTGSSMDGIMLANLLASSRARKLEDLMFYQKALPKMQEVCNEARQSYVSALTAYIIDLALAEPKEPAAGSGSNKPTEKVKPRTSTTSKQRTRTPQEPRESGPSHDPGASAAIGGLLGGVIGGAINRGIGGSRGGGGGSSGSGGNCHHEPATSQQHCK